MSRMDDLLAELKESFGQPPAREWFCKQVDIWLCSQVESQNSYEAPLPEDDCLEGLKYLPEEPCLPWPPRASNEATIPENCAVLAALHDVQFKWDRFIPISSAEHEHREDQSGAEAEENYIQKKKRLIWYLLTVAAEKPDTNCKAAVEQADAEEYIGPLKWMLSQTVNSYKDCLSSDVSNLSITADPSSRKSAVVRVANMLTNGVADKRIEELAAIIEDASLSSNKKLVAIDKLIRIPPGTSARGLAEMLGVSRAAIFKTEWWKNRRSEVLQEIGRNKQLHEDRSKII